MKKLIVILVVCLGLVGCVMPPVSPTAGPGVQLASPQAAGQLFAQVCAANAPDFTSGIQTLAALPFTQNQQSGTYYHNSLNLSFQLRPNRCSLVFRVTTPSVREGFVSGAGSTGIPPSGPIDITVINAGGGQSFARVVTVSN